MRHPGRFPSGDRRGVYAATRGALVAMFAMFVAARVAAPRTATPRAREREASTRAAHGPRRTTTPVICSGESHPGSPSGARLVVRGARRCAENDHAEGTGGEYTRRSRATNTISSTARAPRHAAMTTRTRATHRRVGAAGAAARRMRVARSAKGAGRQKRRDQKWRWEPQRRCDPQCLGRGVRNSG